MIRTDDKEKSLRCTLNPAGYHGRDRTAAEGVLTIASQCDKL
jgi:hypothetical protein